GETPSSRRASVFFFSSRRRHTRWPRDWSSDVCSSDLGCDARYGCRILWRSPSYALLVILTIALGIGINVTVFSVIHAVLWRSLPYPDAGRIVSIEADTQAIPSAYASPDRALDLRQQSRLVTHIATVEGRDASLAVDDVMERVAAARATDNVLPMLGALALGRTLIETQD